MMSNFDALINENHRDVKNRASTITEIRSGEYDFKKRKVHFSPGLVHGSGNESSAGYITSCSKSDCKSLKERVLKIINIEINTEEGRNIIVEKKRVEDIDFGLKVELRERKDIKEKTRKTFYGDLKRKITEELENDLEKVIIKESCIIVKFLPPDEMDIGRVFRKITFWTFVLFILFYAFSLCFSLS